MDKEQKENSQILAALRDLSISMQNLTKETKKSNELNEKFLLLERKKTLMESKSTN